MVSSERKIKTEPAPAPQIKKRRSNTVPNCPTPPPDLTKPTSSDSYASAASKKSLAFSSDETTTTSKSLFNSRPKLLYVGDSVGHTASMQSLERFAKCKIRTARAYSSVYDGQARWPAYNFTDVVKHNLENPGRDNFDV